jgi:hypothetical protein
MSAVGQRSAAPRPRAVVPVVDEAAAVGTVLSHSPALPSSRLSLASAAPATTAWQPLERLALSRSAHRIMRVHLVRSAVRILVLMAGDAAALLLLRILVRGVRDSLWWGPSAAAVMNRLIPPGALPLVQLLPAVLLGLIVLDTYGASDRRRDAGRIVAGATLGLALPFWGYVWTVISSMARFVPCGRSDLVRRGRFWWVGQRIPSGRSSIQH